MRVLMLSKACVAGAYQRKLEEMATCSDIELTLAVPPAWRDERGVIRLERMHVQGYEMAVTPIWLNGSFHLHFYPRLGQLMARVRPDLVHIDEEPYNFAAWHALRLAEQYRARSLFFSWQNILRSYPFPFSRFESDVLRRAAAAIVGNCAARDVWRAKGYAGPIRVIPQFGVDPEYFRPHPPPRPQGQPWALLAADGRAEGLGPRAGAFMRAGVGGEAFVVGYAGRLVPEKGVDLLMRAVAQLPPAVRVHIVGAGPERANLLRLAAQLGVSGRVRLEPFIPSTQMPAFLADLDALVLPSRTRPNWKEQFGRVLVEAMACGVPVIGSTCGEIPTVTADAGLVFPEEDVAALAAHLQSLLTSPELRQALSAKGRARVLEHYTQRRIALETVGLYRDICRDQL